MDIFKKILIFLYITTIICTISILNKPIQQINILHPRANLIKKFDNYINKPFIFCNTSVIDRIVKSSNKFYYKVTAQWDIINGIINIDYKYHKPSLLYKNKVITSSGRILKYETSLLLPSIEDSVELKDVLMVAKSLAIKFPIKMLKSIKYNNFNWIIETRDNQLWYLGYDWSLAMEYLHNLSKKEITQFINNKNNEKFFVVKDNLIIKQSKKILEKPAEEIKKTSENP